MKKGAKIENIHVAPDAADINRFDIDISKKEARAKLGLPQNKKIALYKGHLYAWKGPGDLGKAVTILKEKKNLIAVFIGGTTEDVVAFKEVYGKESNIIILGNRPRQETPIYQKAADILVIPNTAKNDISKLYTSPMKLFGYMAGDRPIIASDIPSLREVIDESMGYFFTPDDPNDLAKTIKKVLNNYQDAESRASKALEKVRQYSWKKRAESILSFIEI